MSAMNREAKGLRTLVSSETSRASAKEKFTPKKILDRRRNERGKSALADEVAGPFLTRDDIAALLVAYYGAVVLEKVRADDLCFDGKRAKQQFREYRDLHLGHIYLLLETLSHVSQGTLQKLTVLAATHKPVAVREVLIRMLAEGSLGPSEGFRMYSAPEFFSVLVKEFDQGDSAPKVRKETFERMMRWLNPDDPLGTSQECEHKKTMPHKVWR